MPIILYLIPLFSLTGFSLFVKKRFSVPIYLCPFVVCSFIAVLLSTNAILGILLPTTITLWISGCVLLLYYLIFDHDTAGSLLCVPTVFFLVYFLYSLIRLNDLQLKHYDNFSHWALIIDWLLRYNQLPTAADPLILFRSYPPASACFSYFFARLNPSESAMALGQAVWIISCLCTLFHPTQSNRRILYPFIFLGGIILLTMNIFLDNLLVDTLLPLCGISTAICLIWSADNPKSSWIICPAAAALVMIKNSGVFFIVAALLIGCLYQHFTQKGSNSTLKPLSSILLTITSLAALLVWRWYTSAAFPDHSGVHAVDATAYASSFLEKWRSGVVWQTSKNLIKQLLKPGSVTNLMIWFLLAFYCFLGIICHRNSRWRRYGIVMLILSCGLWMFWQFFTYLMYIFSATSSEALALSGHERYSLTMLVYLLALAIVSLCFHINTKPSIFRLLVLCTTFLLPLFILNHQRLPSIWRSLDPSTRRANLEWKLETAQIPYGSSCMVYSEHFTMSGYSCYILRYLVHSDQIYVADGSDYQDAFAENLSSCHYLVFADENKSVADYAAAFIEENDLNVELVP